MSEPFQDTSVDALVGQAKEAISRADYQVALASLRQAVQLDPDDREAARLLAQTEEASRRHLAAVERYRAVLEVARRISRSIEQGELADAREQLRAAELEHGQQEAFDEVGEQLAQHEAAARRVQAARLAETARSLLAAEDWQGALDAANRSLELDPAGDLRELREKARSELARQAEHELYTSAVFEARGDVERLLEARELVRAGQRLRQAIDQLGEHPAFAGLSDRIDKAKSDFSFRQRVEWAERRAKEAEGLIAEADRLHRAGSFDGAARQLAAARRLDPSHPELESKIEAVQAAARRRDAERQRDRELTARLAEIASHLDALRLDEAERAIRETRAEFDATARLAALGTRLAHLREVERSGRDPLPSVEALSGEAEAAALAHQRTLAAAYSWKQALLFPFRGFGRVAFLALFAAGVVLDLLAFIPGVGGVLTVVAWVGLLALSGWVPAVVRVTLSGRNLLADWSELANLGRWLRDLGRFVAVVLFAAWPLLAFLLTREWHGGLAAESGPWGWLVAVVLGWVAATLGVVVCGVTEAFGQRQLPRLGRHLRAYATGQPETIWVVAGLFALVLIAVVLRAVAAPALPWMALPAAHGIEIYVLLLAPHLIGVLVRRHRLELARVYG